MRIGYEPLFSEYTRQVRDEWLELAGLEGLRGLSKALSYEVTPHPVCAVYVARPSVRPSVRLVDVFVGKQAPSRDIGQRPRAGSGGRGSGRNEGTVLAYKRE